MVTAKTTTGFRKYHRVLGFFLAGIMTVYALSGVLLIFRGTDFLKYEQTIEEQLPKGMTGAELSEEFGLDEFSETAEEVIFSDGSYNKESGVALIEGMEYPLVIAKFVSLHKSTDSSPLFFMNIFFGVTLLFFAISSFFMFAPKLPIYRTGLKFAAGGFILAVIMVMIS